jgi:O-antigen/teichoic acid export membrane protein
MMRNLTFYIKKLAAGSLAMSLEKASQNMVGLILLPIFAIYLSPEDFGLLSMFTLVATFLGLLYNPGTLSSSVRLYFDTNDEKRQKEIFASTFAFFLLIPIPFTLTIWIFGNRIFGAVFTEFSFMPYGFLGVLLGFFSQPKRIWSEYMIVKYKVVQLAIATFFPFILGSLVSLLCIVWLDMGVDGRVIGMFVAPLALFVVATVTLHRYAAGMVRFSTMLEVVRFGLPLVGAIWAYSILQYTGSYLLERYMGLTEVGIYNIAYRLAGIPMFITLGFRQMWNPVFYENMQSGNFKVITRLTSLFILLFTLLCGITILFAKEVVLLLFDERYYEAIPVIAWVVPGVFFLGLLPLSNAFLGYAKRFGLTSRIALAAGGVNIILCIILIPPMGIPGAALALIISYALYFTGGILFSYRDYTNAASFRALGMTLLLFLPAFVIIRYTSDTTTGAGEIAIKVSLVILWVVAVFKAKYLTVQEVGSLIGNITQRLKITKNTSPNHEE